MVDWNAVGTLAGSLGGFAIIGKWLIRGVERSNESLPVIAESMKTMSDGIKELFDSRNDHDKRLERVETVHDIRGCNEPIKRQSSSKAYRSMP